MAAKTSGSSEQAYDYLTSGKIGEKAYDLKEAASQKIDEFKNSKPVQKIINKFKRFINRGKK